MVKLPNWQFVFSVAGHHKIQHAPSSPIQRTLVANSLQWRHNECDSVSNHQPHDCLFNYLFIRRSKKTQSSASLAFVWGIHWSPVNSQHKGPVTQKMFPFDDVIMLSSSLNMSKRRLIQRFLIKSYLCLCQLKNCNVLIKYHINLNC